MLVISFMPLKMPMLRSWKKYVSEAAPTDGGSSDERTPDQTCNLAALVGYGSDLYMAMMEPKESERTLTLSFKSNGADGKEVMKKDD